MIRVKRNLFTPTYTFFDENEALGILKASLHKPIASFSGKEGDFKFFREKQFEGGYILSSMGHSYIAQAHKPNGIGLKYTLNFEQNNYDIKPGELFYDRLYLHYEVHEADELLGGIIRDSKLLKYLIEIKANLPNIVQIFIFWLALRAWLGETGWFLSRRFRGLYS